MRPIHDNPLRLRHSVAEAGLRGTGPFDGKTRVAKRFLMVAIGIAGIVWCRVSAEATVYSLPDFDPSAADTTGADTAPQPSRPLGIEDISRPAHPDPILQPIPAPNAAVKPLPGRADDRSQAGERASVNDVPTSGQERQMDQSILRASILNAIAGETRGTSYDLGVTAQNPEPRSLIFNFEELVDQRLLWNLLDDPSVGKLVTQGAVGEPSGKPVDARAAAPSGSAWSSVTEGSPFALGDFAAYVPAPQSASSGGRQGSTDTGGTLMEGSNGGRHVPKKDINSFLAEWWDSIMWKLHEYGLISY